jgi:Fur family transcriptional regulator, stress-responsive regulator
MAGWRGEQRATRWAWPTAGRRRAGCWRLGRPPTRPEASAKIGVKPERFQKVLYVDLVTSDFEGQLRAVSLRVTQRRLAVLAALRDHPHVDTDTVIALARADHPRVSHQAVYDVLRALPDAGLVRRIQPADATARYECRVGDNHHHVVCRSCGAIADVDCAVGHAPCLTALDDRGFVVDEAEVVYWGTCPDCATKARLTDSPVRKESR